MELALRFLSYRSRSEAEVERRLVRSGYSSVIIEKTLERLRALRYVDDEAFARDWALARTQKRGDGPKKIELELNAKGIDQEVAREITKETFSQLDEAEIAKKLLRKKYHATKFSDPKAIQRAASFLQNRGYSGKTISDVLHCPVDDY